jgi:hypothetical protein
MMKDLKARNIKAELRRLPRLTVTELGRRYAELFGRPTRCRNKPYLLKNVAWRLQANAEGGLSERTVQRIRDLGDRLPDRWQKRATAIARADKPRDDRLPPPGSVLKRRIRGVEHAVTVLTEGFEYRGEFFESLSTIATHITGVRWNGYRFFLLANGAKS